MRKSLKRVLDRLRSAAAGRRQKETSIRVGLQHPQRFDAVPASARMHE